MPRKDAALTETQPTNRPSGRLSQQDVPALSLEKAARIARAIADNYGYKPTSPIQVAKALGIQPTSGPFRALTGASIAYGLTTGGYNAEQISIEPLGMRIVRPTAEGDDLSAKREALLRPRVVREFLNKYDAAPLPPADIARNVLMDLGVPRERTEQVLELVLEGAEAVGLLSEIKGKRYVELSGDTPAPKVISEEEREEPAETGESVRAAFLVAPQATPDSARARRVYLTHGKNRAFVEPIKKLLTFGELQAVVSTERASVSQPVPDKVMEDMRSCGAAIIHVDDEMRLLDSEASEHLVLNPNVLIEIGGAMALFGRRFILLVKEGIKLPSNLQGLYEVRYQGDALTGDATIKLLEAINDIKNHPLPSAGAEARTRAA